LWGSEVITQRLSSMLYSTNAIQIRIAQQGDFRAIAELHAASWRSTYCGILSNEYLDRNVGSERIDLWEKRFRNPRDSQHIVIAEIQAHIVGFACAYGNEDEQWGTMLDNLHVLPAQKGKGIGSKLVADVALWCSKAHPGQGMFLWAFDRNVQARRFYERLGGVVAGEAIWSAPDGTAVNELRYVWKNVDQLIARSTKPSL